MSWSAKIIRVKKESRIAVYMPYNKEHVKRIKKLEGARWSAIHGAWLLPDTPENRDRFKLELEYVPNPEHVAASKKFRQYMLSKRYSLHTIKAYMEGLYCFFRFNHEKEIAEITEEDFIRFNNDYILKNELSSSYQNQIVNAIKLFFGSIEKKKLTPDLIHRPRPEFKLPNVLSQEEVKAILFAPTNEKHRMMLAMIYSCGLRRGELLNLRPGDIDSERMLVHIYQAKGKKDRIVQLSDKILEMLRSYFKNYRPKVWLFEGNNPGEQYHPRSLAKVLTSAVKKAGINKPVTLHWLRHSYATHLMEKGTDVRIIQELLGHSSIKTTEIYTHVSTASIQQIKSPFDDL